jgi:hypothetical protein
MLLSMTILIWISRLLPCLAEDGNVLTEKGSKDELEQSFSDLNIDDNRGTTAYF